MNSRIKLNRQQTKELRQTTSQIIKADKNNTIFWFQFALEEVREVKKKITVIAGLAILSFLFLTQAPAVYATQEKIYFFSRMGDWYVVDSAVIFDDEGRPWIAQVTIEGLMYEQSPVFGPPVEFGNFTCVDTVYYNYDHYGDMKYWTHNQVVTIINGGDTLTIHATCKAVYGVPTDFQKLGTFKIVEGTGLWSALDGRGEYKFPFEFYGTIR